jgi:predicted nucleotidyltransferase
MVFQFKASSAHSRMAEVRHTADSLVCSKESDVGIVTALHDPAHFFMTVRDRLKHISERENVRILLAVESGSRAFGFASPDSDCDIRFIYARPASWYVRIGKTLDTIEEPVDGMWDIIGWDIRKVLQSVPKGQSQLVEWIKSPVVYERDGSAVDTLSHAIQAYGAGARLLRNYWYLTEKRFKDSAVNGNQRKIKPYMCALRMALVLAWCRMHPKGLPAMDIPTLIAQVRPPSDVMAETLKLVARKKAHSESIVVDTIPVLDAYIQQQLLETDMLAHRPPEDHAHMHEHLTASFQEILGM